MKLLDKMLARHVTRGELTIIDHSGRTRRYGAPDPELKPVTVRITDDMLNVSVVDDGQGTSRATPARVGRGLIGMRERSEILGGQIEVGPRPAGGFLVRARLPRYRESATT